MTLEKLGGSAYVTSKTGTLDEILCEKQEATRLKETRKKESEEAPEKETTWASSHVSEVMSGKSSKATELHRKLVKNHKNKKEGAWLAAGGAAGSHRLEHGLKSKYRGEVERGGVAQGDSQRALQHHAD